MKALKYLSLALVALFAVSCSDDSFEPGAPAQDGEKVAFSADNASKYAMALTDQSVEVKLVREDGTNAVTVPVKLVSSYDGIFSGESSVTFNAGQKEATYVVNVSEKAVAFKTYTFQLIIDESFTNPYVYDETSASPRLECSVVKEDFKVVANGEFSSTVAWVDTWEQDLEYSPSKNIYRMSSLITSGVDYFFFFDGTNFYFTDANGNHVTDIESGYVHPSYGMMLTSIVEDYEMGYDADEDEFYWVWNVNVSAGSFGTNYQELFIKNWIEKPWTSK